jgi:hypothetical protein
LFSILAPRNIYAADFPVKPLLVNRKIMINCFEEKTVNKIKAQQAHAAEQKADQAHAAIWLEHGRLG